MHIPIKGSILSGVIGLSLVAWQGWYQALVVEFDARLDKTAIETIKAVPLAANPIDVYQASTIPDSSMLMSPARLRFALDQPTKIHSSAVYRQIYVQVIVPFQSVLAPLEASAEGLLVFPKGQKVYTAEPLAFSRYRADCPPLVLLRSDRDVIAKVAQEKNAMGIVNTNSVIPQVRTLTSPIPVRLWVEWQASESQLLSALGLNLRLFGNVAQLLASKEIQQKPRLSSMVAVGDVMLGRRIGDAINSRPKEPLYPFTQTSAAIREADIAIGNLECTVAKGGTPQPKKEYTFRAEPKAAQRLKEAGFDIVTLANNHSLDFGDDAFRETLTHLHQAGIETVGGGQDYAQARAVKVMTLKDGTRIGFLGYSLILPKGFAATSKKPGVNWIEDSRFKKQIQRARQRCDVLVVQFHWGKEYQVNPDATQRYYGHAAIDYGADLVIGHHAHWIQEMEFYKGKFIAYSLGNFVFDMNHRPKVREGLMVKCLFRDKSLYQVELAPVIIEKGQPSIIPWTSKQERGRELILSEVFAASLKL